VANDKPIFLRDVAEVEAMEEKSPPNMFRMAHAGSSEFQPAVTIAIAKRTGTNAVIVAEQRFFSVSSRSRPP